MCQYIISHSTYIKALLAIKTEMKVRVIGVGIKTLRHS